ncbi:MAG: hypothetical protein WAK39_09655 [Pseudolabrys sp.]|jgi:hypothetical protein
MWYGSGFSFKGIAGALLLSCFIAGVVTALTSPVTAKNAAPTVSVNRIIKGDRLPPVPATKPKQHGSTPAETPVRKPTLVGCEPAFSPFAEPSRGHILSHCLT